MRGKGAQANSPVKAAYTEAATVTEPNVFDGLTESHWCGDPGMTVFDNQCARASHSWRKTSAER